MAEYIERQRTVELLRSLGNREYRRENGTIQDAIKMISYPEYTPAADVAPVVHGWWEKWNGDDRHHCTVCECYANAERDSYGYIAYEFLDNYCPNCGAQMHEDDFCSYGERKEDKAE